MPSTFAPFEVIETSKVYPLKRFQAITGMGTAALREARRKGLIVRRVGLRSFIRGEDFDEYLRDHGKPVHLPLLENPAHFGGLADGFQEYYYGQFYSDTSRTTIEGRQNPNYYRDLLADAYRPGDGRNGRLHASYDRQPSPENGRGGQDPAPIRQK